MPEKLTQNKLFLYLVYGFFLFLPFERIPTLEVGGYTIKISYIFALLIFLYVLGSRSEFTPYLIRGGNDSKPSINLFDNSNIFLSALWIFSALMLSFNPNRRGFLILSMWAFVFLIYSAFSKILSNQKIRDAAINIIIWVSVLVSIFGLFQFLGDSFGLSAKITQLLPQYSKSIFGFPRIQSVGLEPLYFANFLLVPIFLSFGKYLNYSSRNCHLRVDGDPLIVDSRLRGNDKEGSGSDKEESGNDKEGNGSDKGNIFFNKYFWVLLLLLLNIGLTVSRGAYIAIISTLVLFVIYLFFSKQSKKIFAVILVALLATGLSYLIINKVNGKSASKGFREHSVVMFQDTNKDGSSMDRITTYKVAFGYFKEEPVLGNGLGSFGIRYTPVEKKNEGTYATVNNQYIELLAENGIVGLALFLAFLVSLLILVIKKMKINKVSDNNILIPVCLGCLAILIQYNFFSTLYIIYIWAFLALLKSMTFQDGITNKELRIRN